MDCCLVGPYGLPENFIVDVCIVGACGEGDVAQVLLPNTQSLASQPPTILFVEASKI